MSELRLSRLFCFLLSFLLLCPSFLINASAASDESIISTDFRDWSVFEGNVTLNKSGVYNSIVVNPSSVGSNSMPFCTVYDLADKVVVGNKYKISFNFRNSDPYLGGAGLIGSSAFLDYNGVMYVGLGSLTTSSNGERYYEPVEGCYIQIDKSNYSSITNTLTEFSFQMPNGVVNPCILITFYCVIDDSSTVDKSVYLVFTDFSAVDLTASEEDNFFSRLFEWFEKKFKAIGDSFTDLKDSFTGKINELKESFQNKIDELKQSFIDLKNDLIEGIKSLFVPDEEFITQWKSDMELTLSEHLGFIYQIPALTKDYVTRLQALLNDKSVYLTIPGCEFEFNGFHFSLWEEQSVDFSFLTEAKEGTIWYTLYIRMYPLFLRLTLYSMLINYGKHQWDKVVFT